MTRKTVGSTPAAAAYATVGFFVALTAPLGLLVLRVVVSRVPAATDLAEHAPFYVLTLAGAVLLLTFAGYAAGLRQDFLRLSRDHFRALSNQDPLTHIANARAFEGHYRRVWAASARTRGEVSLLLLDVDDLKKVNEALGHAAGNAVLTRVAEALDGAKRVGDLAARWGGDEFAVLMPGAGAEAARRVAERVLADLRTCRVPFDGRLLTPTVTIGAATRRGGESDDLFELADAALREAKGAGKDRLLVARGAP